jgi:hypothetical protein
MSQSHPRSSVLALFRGVSFFSAATTLSNKASSGQAFFWDSIEYG